MDSSDPGDRASSRPSVIGVDRSDETAREDGARAEPGHPAEPARPAPQKVPPAEPVQDGQGRRSLPPVEPQQRLPQAPSPEPVAPPTPQMSVPHKPVFSPGPASPSASPEPEPPLGGKRQPATAWQSGQPPPAALSQQPGEPWPAPPPRQAVPEASGPAAPPPLQPDTPAPAPPAHPTADTPVSVRSPEQHQPAAPPPPPSDTTGPGVAAAPPREGYDNTSGPAPSGPPAQSVSGRAIQPGPGPTTATGVTRTPPAMGGLPAPKSPGAKGGELITRKRGLLARRTGGGRDLADPQTRFLALALVLEEAGIPSYVRTIILTLTGLVLTGIVWAAITKVDEVAVGPGDVVPVGSVQVVQHLEGGIVSKILVRDGDLVRSGGVLIRLESAQTLAELSQVRAREAGLILQARRLQAFVTGKPPKPLKPSKLAKFRGLAADQLAILKLQELARNKRRNLLKSREASIRRRLVLVKETFQMRKRLLKRGAVSRRDYLEASRELEKVLGELAEAEARQTELDVRLRSDALKERGKVTAELAEVRERLVKLRDRVRRLEIRAPTRGHVKGLTVTTEGGVIRPGQNLMEIVPTDRELIVEVRISTRDVGHIKVGQKAKVKFDTYDFARYGAIIGKLTKVSATTFKDEKDLPYYKGTIKLDKAYLGQAQLGNRIRSGMTVQAEIVTGSKTVLQYLLKPVSVAIDTAFRER